MECCSLREFLGNLKYFNRDTGIIMFQEIGVLSSKLPEMIAFTIRYEKWIVKTKSCEYIGTSLCGFEISVSIEFEYVLCYENK